MNTGSRALVAEEAQDQAWTRSSGHRDYWRAPMALIPLVDAPARPDRGLQCMMLRTYDPDPHESEVTRRARWSAQQDDELRAGSMGTPRTLATEVCNAECRYLFRCNYPGVGLRGGTTPRIRAILRPMTCVSLPSTSASPLFMKMAR